MRILHTADWHLGRTLYSKTRYEEFQKFLDWLLETIRLQSIDALLVAGDVFDTTSPNNTAQQLYYSFLSQLSSTGCRHVVITGGNHDSPTFLEAPKQLLKALDIHIVGSAKEHIDEEVILLRGAEDKPELIVCAVPYLRDRDIRTSEAGESLETKEAKMREGIANHYAQVANTATRLRDSLGVAIPIVAMGHLYTAGGKTVDGDGVRNLYVGNLAHVESTIFPPDFDYVALGHLHVPQKVNDNEMIRFSGSPIPMGFGEAKQKKFINVAQWLNHQMTVELIAIPEFQQLESVEGDWPHIEQRLNALKELGHATWLEITYQGTDPIANLKDKIDQIIDGSPLEYLKVTTPRNYQGILGRGDVSEALEELDPLDTFKRCLQVKQVPVESWQPLEQAYQEIRTRMHEADPGSE
ncbi:MAG: exonuclease subunit SbcD [Planctomycetes bacterium]|nr:exonuclease subunit SbcD [Planctomycetota bacterium]